MRKRVESDPPKSSIKQDLLSEHVEGIRDQLESPSGEQLLLSCLGTDFPLSLPLWAQCLEQLKLRHSLSSGLAFALSLAREMHVSRVFTASLEPLGLALHVLMELVGRAEAFPNWARALEGKVREVKEALFLIEICLERLQEVPEVVSAVGIVAEQVLFKMENFLPMLIAAGNQALEELYMRMGMTLANYIARAFLTRNEAFPKLFRGFKELIKQLSSLYESLFDRIVPKLTHNYWTCRPKCCLCMGNAVSFRYALAACLTGHSDTRVGDIMDYAAELVLEGLRITGLDTGLYLDYIGLYVNIEKPERKPSGLALIPSRLLSLYFSLSDTQSREALFPKMPSAPTLITYLFTQLSSALDSPACLPALISLVADCQTPDQQLFSYIHLRGLVLANASSKALANRVGLGELVLEKCEWVQPVREMIGQLMLTPASLAAFIQRINRALKAAPRDYDTANSLITVLINTVNAGETFALRAIKSLGGLHIFLPALEAIGAESEHCNALRIGVLRVIEAGMELLNDEFVEMLSLALEESGQGYGFDEETVILLLGLFSAHQSKYPDSYLSADFLLFTPNLWQGLSNPLYHSLIFPIQLSCFAHATAKGLDAQVRQYGCVLLAEINKRHYTELDESQSEIVSLLESYLNHVKSPSRVCDLLYLALRVLPDNPQFAIIICTIVQKSLTKPLFTEQKDHNELVAILKAFKPWLEIDKGNSGNELGPRLVQILISSTTQSSRVTLLSLTGKFSVQTGFDDEQLSVLRDLAVVIDKKAYNDLCTVWPYRDTKNPKWLKRALLLADLIPRSKSSCLTKIWIDFIQKLLDSGETGKLQGAEGYSHRWLVDVFDRLVELDTTCELNYKGVYWERVVKLLLTAENYSAVGKFVKGFWHPEKPQRHIQFIQMFLPCLFPPKSPSLPSSKDLLFHFLLSLEDCFHQYPSLTSSIFPVLKLILSSFTPLTSPFPRASPLPIASYERVFTQDCSTNVKDFTIGGLRRVIVSLVVLGLRTAQNYSSIEDILRPVLEARVEGRGSEDLFACDGFLEAYLVTELLVWMYEDKSGPALSVLMRLNRVFQFCEKVSFFLEESLPSYQAYYALLLKHYQTLRLEEPAFVLVDSLELSRVLGRLPGRELEINEAEMRAKLLAYRERVKEVLLATEENKAREVTEDPTWQEAVFLYLVVNTRMRLRPYLAKNDPISPLTEPPLLSLSTNEAYIPRISEVEKAQRLRRAHGKAHWKAICQQLKGVYGLWSSPNCGKVYWKVANYVDIEGKRTRIKRKKSGTDHKDAVLTRNKKEIIRSITAIPKLGDTVPESPITEPCSSPSPRPSGEIDPIRISNSSSSLPLPCERITCLYALYGLLDLNKDYFSFKSCERPVTLVDAEENTALVSSHIGVHAGERQRCVSGAYLGLE